MIKSLVMKSLPLHVKTAIFASLISMMALVSSLLIFSFTAARRFQQEQKQLATLQAENLAEQLSMNTDLIDSDSLQNLIEFVGDASPSILLIRVWKYKDDNFTEIANYVRDDSISESLEPDVVDALRRNVRSSWVKPAAPDERKSLFRVFSPVSQDERLLGAVEIVEQPDTITSIASDYLPSLLWIVLVVFIITNLAFYLFFQSWIYKPIEGLLNLSSGDIEKLPAGNEFRILSDKFNEMVSQLKQLTHERERQNEILQQKIAEATAELKQKNEQLENAHLELFSVYRKMREMERLAAAGQITAQLAHEVATPLSIISGHAQLLKTVIPEESKEAKRLALIIEQIERIEKIVREALSRTRLGVSNQKLLDLNALLSNIFEIVEPILQENKIDVEFDANEELPNILGDADRFQQVFLNLINNSLDAMPNGGKIYIKTYSEQDHVIVEFADTGYGFSEEAMTNLFRPLFTTKQPGKGTGLGLFVIREILQEHNAEIMLESRVGESAHFRIVFKKAQSSTNNQN